MVYKIRGFDILGRATAHEIDIGDRQMGIMGPYDAPWMDFRNLDFTNANLRGADLQGANLEGAILLGADLTEACLHKANLKNVDARYCDFTHADLRFANLENTDVYPSQFFKTHFWGAIMTPGSDIEQQAQIAQQENCKRRGIHPGSVAWKKLAKLNRWVDVGDFMDSTPRTEIVRKPIDFLRHARIDAQIDKVGLGVSL